MAGRFGGSAGGRGSAAGGKPGSAFMMLTAGIELAEGKSNKETATMLNLSLYTVETHRSNILQKLNLHGTPELILYAVRKGVIS